MLIDSDLLMIYKPFLSRHFALLSFLFKKKKGWLSVMSDLNGWVSLIVVITINPFSIVLATSRLTTTASCCRMLLIMIKHHQKYCFVITGFYPVVSKKYSLWSWSCKIHFHVIVTLTYKAILLSCTKVGCNSFSSAIGIQIVQIFVS